MTDTRGEAQGPHDGEATIDASQDDALALVPVEAPDGSTATGFLAGTMIATPDGARSVETLAEGDRVTTSTGDVVALRGVRHRRVDGRAAGPMAWPVRIATHAFGEGCPARDVRVAPDALLRLDFLGDMLVPVAPLVNAATIAQEASDNTVVEVGYHELELDSAAALLADGLAVQVGGAVVGDGARHPPTYGEGLMVEATRLRLGARLDALGWTLDMDAFAGLHLLVDGERVAMRTAGLAASAMIAVSARHVWLVSAAATPKTVLGSLDDRLLGVPLAAISIDDGLSPRRSIALDDPRLCVGFHAPENALRWTTGRARLPAALWEGCEGHAFVRVELHGPGLPRWVRPAT